MKPIATRPLLWEFFAIIGGCIVLSVLYGIAHDMVTAHYCPAYFLPPYHPILVDSKSPAILAIVWGFMATFWVGGFLGLFIAISSQIGPLPRLATRYTLILCAKWLIGLWLFAMSILLGVNALLRTNPQLSGYVGSNDLHIAVTGVVHTFSYVASIFVAVAICTVLVSVRWKIAQAPSGKLDS